MEKITKSVLSRTFEILRTAVRIIVITYLFLYCLRSFDRDMPQDKLGFLIAFQWLHALPEVSSPGTVF
jgi:hypothetical protein